MPKQNVPTFLEIPHSEADKLAKPEITVSVFLSTSRLTVLLLESFCMSHHCYNHYLHLHTQWLYISSGAYLCSIAEPNPLCSSVSYFFDNRMHLHMAHMLISWVVRWCRTNYVHRGSLASPENFHYSKLISYNIKKNQTTSALRTRTNFCKGSKIPIFPFWQGRAVFEKIDFGIKGLKDRPH